MAASVVRYRLVNPAQVEVGLASVVEGLGELGIEADLPHRSPRWAS